VTGVQTCALPICHFWAVRGKLMETLPGPTNEPFDPSSERSLRQWFAVSRIGAREHGEAFPRASWGFQPGSARKLASHDDDYLFYASPLTGEFEIEVDAMGFGFRDTEIMVGGHWVKPIFNHEQYARGTVRGEASRGAIDPPLSDTTRSATIHHRVTIDDDRVRYYFNGREACDRSVAVESSPWLAVRSNYRNIGGVDDLRITGTPKIPSTIALSESADLVGWYEYFRPADSRKAPLRHWSAEDSSSASKQEGERAGIEIVGRQRPELPNGSNSESVLVYARPIREDGFIEYSFWYERGVAETHPVIGRECFLLQPDSIRVHRLTDGRYETTRLRADNLQMPEDQPRHTTPLPLKSGAWNRIRIELSEATVSLNLNGVEIHSGPCRTEPAKRFFGLFHYADQTVARVRDVRWTGDWPRQLPPLAEQQLAAYPNRFLEESTEQLSEAFQHRFDKTSLQSRRFRVVAGDPAEVRVTDQGVELDREGHDGYHDTQLSPAVQVGGDFDITVAYDQMQCDSSVGKVGSVRLEVKAANESEDRAMIQRGEDRQNGQIIQCAKVQTIRGAVRRHYFAHQPYDTTAGRLRLSRRGEKVYYLTAENDSKQFRMIGEEDFTDADLKLSGIRMGIQIQGVDGRMQARLREFDIRAERLGGLAMDDPDKKLAELDRQRAALPASFEHSFVEEAPAAGEFHRWVDVRPWKQSDGGLTIQSPGNDDWTSAGMGLLKELRGDFDIRVTFDPIDLTTPAKGKRSQVFLQAELADPDRTQLSAILTRTDQGSLIGQGQIRIKLASGYRYDTLSAIQVQSMDQLRLARRGKRIHYIGGSSAEGREFLMASTSVDDAPISRHGLRLLVHTGGSGRTSRVLIKSLDVRCQEIIGPMAVRGFRPAPAADSDREAPKSLLKSFLDVFK